MRGLPFALADRAPQTSLVFLPVMVDRLPVNLISPRTTAWRPVPFSPFLSFLFADEELCTLEPDNATKPGDSRVELFSTSKVTIAEGLTSSFPSAI